MTIFSLFAFGEKTILFRGKEISSNLKKFSSGKSRGMGIPEKFSNFEIFLLGLAGLDFILWAPESRGSGIS